MPRLFWWIFSFLVFLGIVVFCPGVDLFVSGLFGDETGFFLAKVPVLSGLVKLVFYAARGVAGFFLLLMARAWFGRSSRRWERMRPWGFLLLSLLIGPGLIVNLGLKDHWGRARPREVIHFGGTASFTPAWQPSIACERNCSFASGDAAFGFFLPQMAYVASRRRRRLVFLTGLGGALVLSLARLVLGAHFLSDILFAAAIVTVLGAVLHALFYGAQATRDFWRERVGDPVVRPSDAA